MQKVLKLVVILSVVVFSIIGASCDVVNDKGSSNENDLVGSWQLTKQTGSQQDVCPNETITFQTGGTVTLQCPGQPQIQRTYTTSNGVVTYTETGVSFEFYVKIESGITKLELIGRNVQRNLYYNKVTVDKLNNDLPKSAGNSNYNSSEKIK